MNIRSAMYAVGSRWALFSGLLVASFLPAWFSSGKLLSEIAFAWVLIALAPEGFASRSAPPHSDVFLKEHGLIITATYWVLAGLLFAWIIRRVRFRYAPLLVIPAVAAALVLGHLSLALFGLHTYSSF
jgi:hypothetical protein